VSTEWKHTKGPWSEHGKGGCECGMIFGPDGNVLVAIVQGPSHLDIEGPDCVPTAATQKANARLISRAPALLAMVERLAAFWSDLSDGDLTKYATNQELGSTRQNCEATLAARRLLREIKNG
jgi:hypothetical protein